MAKVIFAPSLTINESLQNKYIVKSWTSKTKVKVKEEKNWTCIIRLENVATRQHMRAQKDTHTRTHTARDRDAGYTQNLPRRFA